jgi:hypothetical protein
MSNVIQADELKRIRAEAKAVTPSKAERFNKLVKQANDCGNTMTYLHFESWGYNKEDVQWIEDAGYHVYRNEACLWYEVSWE